MFSSPSQVLFSVFGFKIYYYGVIMAIAIVAGVLSADYIGKKYFSFKKDTFVDLAPYLIFFGIIGARLYYCILNYEFYMRFPTEILAIRHGGISIHGAILGGLIGLFIYSKRRKTSMIKLADVSVVGLSLAQSIGRWGNFFNSEAFGIPTNLPWKLYIAPQYRPIPYTDCNYFHPTFLYESIFDFLICAVLIWCIKTNKFQKSGNLTFLYLILYSVIRIFIELLRIDSVRYIHSIPVAIVASVVIIMISVIGLFIINLKKVAKN